MRNASELPLEWKTGVKTCEVGEGCQDLVMLLENGKKPPPEEPHAPSPGILHPWEGPFLASRCNPCVSGPFPRSTSPASGCPNSLLDPGIPIPASTRFPSSIQDP